MGATDEQSRAEALAVSVTNSHCYSKSVLAHAADQDCKDTGSVVSKVLDEPGTVGMMKILNALKTPIRMVRILLVPEPPYQCSPIWKKVLVSSLVIHQVSLSAYIIRSPKEFSSPAEKSRRFGDKKQNCHAELSPVN